MWKIAVLDSLKVKTKVRKNKKSPPVVTTLTVPYTRFILTNDFTIGEKFIYTDNEVIPLRCVEKLFE